jgi:hypothetical protein
MCAAMSQLSTTWMSGLRCLGFKRNRRRLARARADRPRLGGGAGPEEHETDREDEEQHYGPKQPRGVCMQAEQEAHAQETATGKPGILSQRTDGREREGMDGGNRRDKYMDQPHLDRARGRCA